MDDPSAQLYLDLRAAVTEALGSRRPLLHHLNADTSWLLQIPRPVLASRRGGRFYFNILIDPWLAGGQSDVAKWFSQQFHATESKVGSIAAVEELLRQIEILAEGLRSGQNRRRAVENMDENGDTDSLIDVVAISHEFTDHCHKDTLVQVHPDVPVFATDKAAPLIRGWNHFRQVQKMPHFGSDNPDWHSTSIPPLPDWLGISRLVTKGDALYYHSAVLIAFNNMAGSPAPQKPHDERNGHGTQNGTSDQDRKRKRTRESGLSQDNEHSEDAEAVIYTPHGIHNENLSLIPNASPPIRTLAFLHGLHDISIGSQQQLNLGAHNGLKAQRLLDAKYWIGTHDEMKKGGGLVSWFLRRKVISIKEALENERSGSPDEHTGKDRNGLDGTDDILDSFKETHWLELANGESRLLV